jgi:tRNA nucleotidyltransferase (CCA-adding enzyme)
VTLEDDLARRDLTVNAMARDGRDRLVDPWGGLRDLEARVLRHVSPAFVEDPVRVLRVARFAARLAPLGFDVAPETLELMRQMADSGECDALVPERVWAETERALSTERPDVFVSVLRQCGALVRVYPELDALFGVPQPRRWHPEVDTGRHLVLTLRRAAELGDSVAMRFAVMVHDLGKGTTPRHLWPSHHGHEVRGVALVDSLCDRLRVPNACRELGTLAARWHGHCHRAMELRPTTVLKLLEGVDAFRRPERFELFLLACQADLRGRDGLEQAPYPQADRLRRALEAARAVDAAALAAEGTTGAALGEALRRQRVRAIGRAIGRAGPGAQT